MVILIGLMVAFLIGWAFFWARAKWFGGKRGWKDALLYSPLILLGIWFVLGLVMMVAYEPAMAGQFWAGLFGLAFAILVGYALMLGIRAARKYLRTPEPPQPTQGSEPPHGLELVEEIEAVCPCGARFSVPPSWTGKRAKCPKCKTVFKVGQLR